MNPLSVWNYYRNNIKKLMPVFIAVSLSVFLLYTVQMLIFSAFRTEYLAFVKSHEYFSYIKPIGKLMDQELIDSVKNQKSVEYVLPFIFNYTNITNTLGDVTGTKILSMKSEDTKLMMSRLGLSLTAGRLPVPGSDEVALHSLVAENKGLKIGDKVGKQVNGREFYPGSHTISGILDGESIISFDSLETWLETNKVTNPLKYGMVILPVKGHSDEMNAFLDSLYTGSIDLKTLGSASSQHYESVDSVGMILTLIDLIIIIIVSLCAGFLFYIFFNQRRVEFGILNAIGFTRQQIINKAIAEIAGLNAAGFLAGIAIAVLTALLFNWFMFIPKGQLLLIWDAGYIERLLCVPVFVTLFSIIPVWRMLDKLDPVSIIEGEGWIW